MTVRTAVIDELVLACIEQGACTVINLGAGLDTRAFRLTLPAAVHWIDVDLPDMVVHRLECLGDAEPTCRHSHMAADVCDAQAVEAVLSLARSTAGPVVVITEGLLLYLTEDQVARLAGQLFGEPQVAWLIGDFIIGVVGAFIGSWLLPQLGVHIGVGMVAAIVNATIGAMLLLFLLRAIRGSGRFGGRSWWTR